MKQTVTINLAGVVFHIDEDAHLRLQTYLQEIENNLKDNDSKEEIMQDIEARIAELFDQHMKYSHSEVATITMVNDVEQQLGSPAEIGGNEAAADKAADEAQTVEAEEVNSNANLHHGRRAKKVYRDIDNQRIGGVCAGLGHLWNVDPFWFRLLFVLLLFGQGIGLLIYLILWVVMPAANTAARRLEMRGEDPTVDNIRQEVEQQGPRPANNEHSALRILMMCLLGIIALPAVLLILFIIGVLIFALFAALFGISMGFAPLLGAFGVTGAMAGSGVVTLICLVLFFLIPIITLIVWAVHRNKSDQPMHRSVWIVAVILWLLSLIGLSVFGHKSFGHLSELDWDSESFEQRMDAFGEQMDALGDSIEMVMEQYGDSIEKANANVKVQVYRPNGKKAHVAVTVEKDDNSKSLNETGSLDETGVLEVTEE